MLPACRSRWGHHPKIATSWQCVGPLKAGLQTRMLPFPCGGANRELDTLLANTRRPHAIDCFSRAVADCGLSGACAITRSRRQRTAASYQIRKRIRASLRRDGSARRRYVVSRTLERLRVRFDWRRNAEIG